MNEIQINSGKHVLISEIPETATNLEVFGKSVTVTGKLTEHNVSTCIAKLTDPQSKKQVTVDTSLIEPFDGKYGSLFQMIGELETNEEEHVVFKPRVIREVEGLDFGMFVQAVQCQRDFFAERKLLIPELNTMQLKDM